MQYAKTVSLIDTGLATVGYTLYDIDGSVFKARTETSVIELGSTGVYFVKLEIQDEFNGVLVWDDGTADPIYSSEDLAGHQNTKLGQITDGLDIMLQSIAMHRAAVEPIIDKLDLKSVEKVIKSDVATMRKELIKSIEAIKSEIKSIEIPKEDKNYQTIITQSKESNDEIVNIYNELEKMSSLFVDYSPDIRKLSKIIVDQKQSTDSLFGELQKNIKDSGTNQESVQQEIIKTVFDISSKAYKEFISGLSIEVKTFMNQATKNISSSGKDITDSTSKKVDELISKSIWVFEEKFEKKRSEMIKDLVSGIPKEFNNINKKVMLDGRARRLRHLK